MTREDIDNIISALCPNDEDYDKPIISPRYLKQELEQLALEQKPCEDAISRQEALKLFATHDGKYLYEAIRDMPSVEQVPKTDSDCVSRQAVLNTLEFADKVLDEDRTVERYKAILTEAYEVLPSVNSQEPILDKIRAEIADLVDDDESYYDDDPDDYYKGYYEGVIDAIQVIIKYS